RAERGRHPERASGSRGRPGYPDGPRPQTGINGTRRRIPPPPPAYTIRGGILYGILCTAAAGAFGRVPVPGRAVFGAAAPAALLRAHHAVFGGVCGGPLPPGRRVYLHPPPAVV